MNAISTSRQHPDENSRMALLEGIVNTLKKIDKDTGEYLELYLETFLDYENEYAKHPQEVARCVTGLQGTQQEITSHFDKVAKEQGPQLTPVMDDLFAAIKERPVLLWSMQFLKKFCSTTTVSQTQLRAVVPEQTEESKYWVANVLWSQQLHEKFFKAMGFEYLGGGSNHLKWYDPVTKLPFMVSGSSSLTSKTVVKELLDKSTKEKPIPLTRIKAAFDKLKIDFKIIPLGGESGSLADG